MLWRGLGLYCVICVIACVIIFLTFLRIYFLIWHLFLYITFNNNVILLNLLLFSNNSVKNGKNNEDNGRPRGRGTD